MKSLLIVLLGAIYLMMMLLITAPVTEHPTDTDRRNYDIDGFSIMMSPSVKVFQEEVVLLNAKVVKNSKGQFQQVVITYGEPEESKPS